MSRSARSYQQSNSMGDPQVMRRRAEHVLLVERHSRWIRDWRADRGAVVHAVDAPAMRADRIPSVVSTPTLSVWKPREVE